MEQRLPMMIPSPSLPWQRATGIAALLVAAAVALLQIPSSARSPQRGVGSQGPLPVHQAYPPAAIDAGGSLFLQNCAFCHGKDAGGGESGPDLTRSHFVAADKAGENIGAIIRNGRVEKGMPRFSLPDDQVTSLVAFVHSQQDKAMSQTGVRKGVDVSDLQTGNVEAGKAYFHGPGGCAKCHNPTGDLAGIASRYEGLNLEQQMLAPKGAKATVTVTTPQGPVTGALAYQDEFSVALTDPAGKYRSWPTATVQFKVDSPAKAHIDLFDKYTDDDIHNLMAYLQTLR